MSVGVPMEFPVDYVDNGDGTARPIYANQNSRLRVRFKRIRQLDRAATLREGKEVYTEQVLLVKKVKGSTNAPTSRATEADKRRYRKEWEAFVRGEGSEEGTSLADLYGIKPQDVRYLHESGIYTIEELLDAPDERVEEIDPNLELKELARIFLTTKQREEENQNAIVVVETYKARNAQLEEEIASLKAQMAEKPKRRTEKKSQLK